MKKTYSNRSRFIFAVATAALVLAGPAQAAVLTDLVHYWQFEDYTDSAGTNTMWWADDGTGTAPTIVTGQVGNAISLAGDAASPGYNFLLTSQAAGASLLGSNARTINLWFQTAADASLPLVSLGATANNGELFEMTVIPSGNAETGAFISLEGRFGTGAGYETSFNNPDPVVTLNTWTMATLVYDGNTSVKVYQDGALVTDYTLAAQLNTVPLDPSQPWIGGNILFGTSNSNATVRQFMLDDVAMWSRALTDAEVGQIYAAGDQGLDLYAVPEPSTVALYAGLLTLGLVMIRRRRNLR